MMVVRMETDTGSYRKTKSPGAAAAILYKNKILFAKRINLPFIINPGCWAFIAGKREHGEKYLQTALRELKEETGLMPSELKLILKKKITFLDHRRKTRWDNQFFIFSSKTKRIDLNIENTDYKWFSLNELAEKKELQATFADAEIIIKILKSALEKKNSR